MSAIVTDQFRILNASNFVDSVENSSNSYYVFVGLSNATQSSPGFGRSNDWDINVPNPIDNVDYLNHYASNILFGKKITSQNIRRVIKKIEWFSGKTYEMYRPDYSIYNPSPISGSMRLYDAEYYVINSDYRVYICIHNGSSADNVNGNQSTVEPIFTELEPIKLSDGYTWKYLYTISPNEIIKFDSTEYITLPNNWRSSTDSQILTVRENGDSSINKNQIKKVYINNSGLGYTTGTFFCNLVGDGYGGAVSVTVDSSTKISDVNVVSGGNDYSYALVDLKTTTDVVQDAELIPIIPPSKGHGFDIYKELGADKLLIYVRFDDSTKDFPINTKFSQIGIIKNPTSYNSSGIKTSYEFSGVYSAMLNTLSGDVPEVGDIIEQIQSDNKKALGYVVSYDSETNVLKYNRDRSLYYNADISIGVGTDHKDFIGITTYYNDSGNFIEFNSSSQIIKKGGGWVATIKNFSGFSTSIQNKNINLGVEFKNGFANPEINNKSGEIIYINNRPTITRNSRQKEDIKIILEF